MKKLILTFGIFLAGIFFVNAQAQPDRATKLINRITQICNLTPDQVTKAQPLAEQFFKDRDANKQQYANDPAGLKTANIATRKDYKTKLYAILTPDQQQKLKAANEQRKANMKNGTSTGNQEDDQ